MANWVIRTAGIFDQEIDETSTTQKIPLGTEVKAYDTSSDALGGGTFVYAKGVASTVLGSVCALVNNGESTVLATANGKYRLIGTAMSANVANQYGWYQIVGKGVGKVLTGFADDADCYLTSTAGSIDDADVAGDYIRGMKGAAAIGTPAAGLAYLQLNRPNTTDGADN